MLFIPKLSTNWYFSNRASWLIESCLGGALRHNEYFGDICRGLKSGKETVFIKVAPAISFAILNLVN